MNAFIHTNYGSPYVLQLTDIEKTLPRDDEGLIKTQAVPIIGSGQETLTSKPHSFRELPAVMRYVSEGFAKGKVVINMEES